MLLTFDWWEKAVWDYYFFSAWFIVKWDYRECKITVVGQLIFWVGGWSFDTAPQWLSTWSKYQSPLLDVTYSEAIINAHTVIYPPLLSRIIPDLRTAIQYHHLICQENHTILQDGLHFKAPHVLTSTQPLKNYATRTAIFEWETSIKPLQLLPKNRIGLFGKKEPVGFLFIVKVLQCKIPGVYWSR